jgi:hypothetical protein
MTTERDHVFLGEENNQPIAHAVEWHYPTDGSALTIDIDHVRVIDEVRLRFDFTAHEWVAEMERQGADNLSAPTGEWIEVARWSGNVPTEQSEADVAAAVIKGLGDDLERHGRAFAVKLATHQETAQPKNCPNKLDCGGNCRMQLGHEGPCLCVGDTDGPDTCPA